MQIANDGSIRDPRLRMAKASADLLHFRDFPYPAVPRCDLAQTSPRLLLSRSCDADIRSYQIPRALQ
jgi:hypothetical protein